MKGLYEVSRDKESEPSRLMLIALPLHGNFPFPLDRIVKCKNCTYWSKIDITRVIITDGITVEHARNLHVSTIQSVREPKARKTPLNTVA